MTILFLIQICRDSQEFLLFHGTHHFRSHALCTVDYVIKILCLQEKALIIDTYSVPLIKTQRADYLEQKQVLCADRLFIRDYVYTGIF